MKKTVGLLFIVGILMIVSVSLVSANGIGPIEPRTPQPSAETSEMVDETPSLWFVELKNKPTADGGNPKAIKSEQRSFRNAAKNAGLQFDERYAFKTLWNGLSIKIDPSDFGKLARVPGVAALYPVTVEALPPTLEGANPDLYTAIQMTGADIAQSELGYTGAGIKVAVMDTGIDYDHPDLGGCFGPGCRVAYGYDLVGDDFNADDTSPSYNPIPVPDEDPDDCQGHGTHVSGIVGANGGVTGVAPEVTFGAYRVFGCEGSTFSDIMIAAMEMALEDDMDILNMSIGSAFQWPQYPTAQASDRLVNKGMVVVASIGNSGTRGLYSTGAPGVGKKVIGTASFDNTHAVYPVFEVNDTDIGYNPMSYSATPPTSGTEEIVWVGRACDIDLQLLDDPSGKVALITRGACSFREKALNAQAAGASAVVIHNSSPGNFNGTLGSPMPTPIVVVSISLEEGEFIKSQATPTFMTWTDRSGSFPSPTAGLISSFSSYGLAPDLSLKPDIGAPGGNIYSTIPLEQGGYGVKGGTSMASPHVAGAAALMLEAKPNINSQVMRDLFQNSADPKAWWGFPGGPYIDNVHRQGAGMVDIDDAILATTKITPGKIATGESEAGPFVQMLTIENKAASDVTYDLSYVNALSTGGVIAPSFWLSDASVAFNTPSVTVPAGGEATVMATIHPSSYPDYALYGGYIVFTPQDGGQVYRVPYAGFVGDYQSIETLAPTPYEFPWLSVLLGGSFKKLEDPGDWTFTMEAGDIPYFLVHFEHQPEKWRMEVFSDKGKAWHRAYDERYFGRNSTSTSFFAFPFDGHTVNGKRVNMVPDGEYFVVISVLKANGDDDNPAHWETWTSPNFVIDRP
jgi:subtilisin family serine protease